MEVEMVFWQSGGRIPLYKFFRPSLLSWLRALAVDIPCSICLNINLFMGKVTVMLMKAAPQPHTNSLLSSLRGIARLVALVAGEQSGKELTLSLPEVMDFPSPACGGVTTPRVGVRVLFWCCPTMPKPITTVKSAPRQHYLVNVSIVSYVDKEAGVTRVGGQNDQGWGWSDQGWGRSN